MDKLERIKYKNVNVLTSKQLAVSYGTTVNRIKNNFMENKSKYAEGKHYFKLVKEELKQFKNRVSNSDIVNKRAPELYLWTERGALLHAKSLNTDKAWEVYNGLIKVYFNAKEINKQFEKPFKMPYAMQVDEEIKRVNYAEFTNIFKERLMLIAKKFNLLFKYKGSPKFFGLVYKIIYTTCFNGTKKEILNYLGVTKKNEVLVDYIYGFGLDFLHDTQMEFLTLLNIYEGDFEDVHKALMVDIEDKREVYIKKLEKSFKKINVSEKDTKIIIEFLRKNPVKLNLAKRTLKEQQSGQLQLDCNNPLELF